LADDASPPTLRAGPWLLAAAAVLAGALLLVRVPAVVSDSLLALLAVASLVVLAVAAVVPRPAAFSSFPALIVVSSVVRLMVCLAAARGIIATGQGGPFLAGLAALLDRPGPPITGSALLLLLAVVQLVVVGAGVTRVAEVAARFALDALPGKQLSLDAAIGSGQLTAQQARVEMLQLEAQAGFYGAMDGAARFVRGEAAAIIAIVATTIVACLLRAPGPDAWQPVAHAVSVGVLSLVSALLVGTAAAVMTARASAAVDLAEEVAQQAGASTAPFFAGALAGVVLAAAIPHAAAPLLLAAAASAAAGLWVQRRALRAQTAAAIETTRPERARPEVELEVGLALAERLLPPHGDLLDRIAAERRRLQNELGVVLPTVQVRDSIELHANEYRLLMRGIPLAAGRVRPRGWFLPDDAGGRWVSGDELARLGPGAQQAQPPAAVIAANLARVLHLHAAEFFGRQAAAELIEAVRRAQPALGEAAERAGADTGLVREVGAQLLREGVPLSAPEVVLEAVVDALPAGARAELIEHVRSRLARVITTQAAGPDATVRAIGLDAELEAELVQTATEEWGATKAALDPGRAERLTRLLGREAEALRGEGRRPVLVCGAEARPAAAALVAEAGLDILVVSRRELLPAVNVAMVQRLTAAQLAPHTSATTAGGWSP